MGKDEAWGGTKYFVAGGGGGPERVDYSIMGYRDGKTKYVWPKRIMSYEKDGIIPPSENIKKGSAGFRNDEMVKNQLMAVLEPNFVHLKINGNIYDTMIAESLVNEIGFRYDLGSLGWDYCGKGKNETELFNAAKDWGVDPKADMVKLPALDVGN